MYKNISKRDIIKSMIDFGYLVYKDGVPIITQDFLQLCLNLPKEEVKEKINELAKKEVAQPGLLMPTTGLKPIAVKKVEPTLLADLIINAKVPATASTSSGSYAVNKYNEKAEKILKKAVKEGLNLEVITVSTQLYYLSGVVPKTIGNYFIEGVWKDEYNKLADKISEGMTSANEYIRSVTSKGLSETDGTSRYKR